MVKSILTSSMKRMGQKYDKDPNLRRKEKRKPLVELGKTLILINRAIKIGVEEVDMVMDMDIIITIKTEIVGVIRPLITMEEAIVRNTLAFMIQKKARNMMILLNSPKLFRIMKKSFWQDFHKKTLKII